MHKKIHRFQRSGIIMSDSDIPRKRVLHTRSLVESARQRGYIPVLDIDSSFSTKYDGKKFTFLISVYFIYVGKRKAEEWEGYSGGRFLPKTSAKASREQSLSQ